MFLQEDFLVVNEVFDDRRLQVDTSAAANEQDIDVASRSGSVNFTCVEDRSPLLGNCGIDAEEKLVNDGGREGFPTLEVGLRGGMGEKISYMVRIDRCDSCTDIIE